MESMVPLPFTYYEGQKALDAEMIGEQKMNYTYLLECSDGTLYCGWTNDLEKRVKAHNTGHGAKYTKSRRPVRLVWYETFETKEEAMSREAKVKQLSRKQKEDLVAQGPVRETDTEYREK